MSRNSHQTEISTSLSLAAQTVAVLDIILDSIAISMGVWYMIFITRDATTTGLSANIVVLSVYLVYMAAELIVGIFLLIGVTMRYPVYCEVWLAVCLFNLMVKGVRFIYTVGVDKERLSDVGASAVEPLIRCLMFFIVYSFTKKLKLILRPKSINVYYLLREEV